MNGKGITISLGLLLLGLGVGLGVGFWQARLSEKHALASQAETQRLTAENAAKTQEIALLREELEKARTFGKVADRDATLAENKLKDLQPATTGGSQKDSFANKIQAMSAEIRKNQNSAKLASLKLRLKLTDAQEAEIKKILDEQSEWLTAFTQEALSGKLRKPGEIFRLDEKISKVLSPDQNTTYAQMQKEQQANNREMMANAQLGQIQQVLSLTEQQKDQIFSKLAAETTFNPSEFHGSAQEMLDAQYEKKKENLRDILTPEQFEIYSQQVDAEREMVRKMMPATPQ